MRSKHLRVSTSRMQHSASTCRNVVYWSPGECFWQCQGLQKVCQAGQPALLQQLGVPQGRGMRVGLSPAEESDKSSTLSTC